MKKLNDIKILVVGDIMLDKYIIGTVNRISPEAPVPIVHVKNEYDTLGGAGNVIRNIRELGSQVDCLASVGNDICGSSILQKIDELKVGNFLFLGSGVTTVKERIIAEHRLVQMLRIDKEEIYSIEPKLAIRKFKEKSKKNNYDMIIISDYAKGMITYELLEFLKNNIKAPIIIDPKPQNAWMYNNILMITPNEKEWTEMQLSSKPGLRNIKYVLKTMGKKGMKLLEGHKELFIEADPVDVYNTSGAGDTVVAIIAVCISIGFDVEKAVRIANKCASYVVTQPGTAVVPIEKFEEIIKAYY